MKNYSDKSVAACGAASRPGSLDRIAVPALLRDRVVIGLLVITALLATIDPAQAVRTLDFAGRAIVGILPFLAAAVALAACIRASGADRLIGRAFSGSARRSIGIAAAVGALSPFCSCGVVPVIAGLLRAGVPLAPVMAFWIASPIMDPEMFLLTAAGISPGFAIAKTAAAAGMGLLAGFTIHLLRRRDAFSSPLTPGSGGGSCKETGTGTAPVVWRFWRDPARRKAFFSEVGANAFFLGKWLALAFLLEGLMLEHLPAELVTGMLGSGSWHEIPLAAALGIPAYLNGYAAVPLVAGLLDLGVNPGAAMTFMTAGAVSSIPAAVAVAAVVRRPVFTAYLALGLTGSIAAGLVYAIL